MKSDARVARWVEVVTDLLQQPLTVFPHVRIASELRQTFEVTALSWNWREHDGSFGHQLFPFIHELFASEARDAWDSGEMLERHPLIKWFAATGEPASQSIGRVPVAISGRHDRDLIAEILHPFECDEQMSIPYVLDGSKHRAFVLARSGDDFSADDLEVARRLQPLLAALSTQASILSGGSEPFGNPAAHAFALTGREVAVLRLLAEGYTAYGISRRLSNSPRTVHKHLEHIYRKLGVVDRLSAVQLAIEVGLVHKDRPVASDPRESVQPEFPVPRLN